MMRPKSPAEQQRFRSYFQNLNVNQAMVTGEPSSAYNCVAWTVGLKAQWIWPGSSLGHFDTFYHAFGFLRASNGPVAVWGHASNEITHCSISGPEHGPRWESKCGADLRIQHGLNELNGNTYGRVLAFYTPAISIRNNTQKLMEILEKGEKKLGKEEKTIITKEAAAVPRKLAIEFEKQFEVWRNSWFAGRMAINSNPCIRANSYEFFKLVKMGEAIIPLVIRKLTEKDNFFALQLYERLQQNPHLIVEQNLESGLFIEGEQGRAFRTVTNYLKNR